MVKLWRQRLGHAVGLRLAVWYAAVFLLTSVAVGLLTYRLLVTSLERRDHDLLLVKLEEYAVNYEQGGLESVQQSVSAERASGSTDAVMVRLIGGGEEHFPRRGRNENVSHLAGQGPCGPTPARQYINRVLAIMMTNRAVGEVPGE